ncbi:MFS transporter [Nocardia uniformis]|uniref:MFS transporter n=1 Tax=Nocardia uniformis TaxID=53432 RepID=A0A849BYJ9_9NOCA|nr:MFS transporter [Nocardia uniformis]NNH68747.1 MFS transporter [Nocardia uniformis]
MSLKSGARILATHPRFRILFWGRLISLTGSAVAPIAQAFAVLDLTGSATAFGVVLAVGYAPLIAFLLVGGVVADRFSRSSVMVWSNWICAAAQVVLAVLLVTGHARVWHIAVAAAVVGGAGAFFGPASQGIVPQVVEADRLHDANALLRLSMNGIKVLGPAVGGVAVAFIGSGWVIAWDAASFALAAVLLARLRVDLPPRPPSRFRADLAEGWSEFWSRSWMWSLVLQYSLVNAVWVGCFQLLGPIISQQNLGGPAAWGIITAALACGLLAGGVLILAWKPRRPLLAAASSTFAKALPLVALAYEQPLWAVAAATFAAGIGTEVFVVCFYSTLQRLVPADRVSRVSSYDILFGTVLIPFGYLIAGPVSDRTGTFPTIITGVGIVVASTFVVLALPSIRTYRAPTETKADIST